MNQEKCGKFISRLRKEKNMTQEELAQKIGVSINAVSKWERGINFVDASLYKKLSKELGISIDELINGEKNNNKNIKESKYFKKIIIISLLILMFILFLLAFYSIKIKIKLINNVDYLYEDVINYIKEKEFDENPDFEYKDFNTFYSYYGFGIEKDNDYKYVYMWLYNQSYYIEVEGNSTSLANYSGYSLPIKVIFKNDTIKNIIYPDDGNRYIKSIKKNFPKVIWNDVIKFNDREEINQLFSDVENQKNIYYNYLTLDMSKITVNDITCNDIIFSIEYNSKCDVPTQLTLFKDNKYRLYTEYKACKKGNLCNMMLVYTNHKEGKYQYDLNKIIRHSIDSNNYQFINSNLPEYTIRSGCGNEFITDSNNRYLKEFLKINKIDLTICAKPKYVN